MSRDASWLSRLERLALRGGWPFESQASLPAGKTVSEKQNLIVLDRAVAGSALGRAIESLRRLYPPASIALAFDEGDMESAAAAVTCGADDILGKVWPDAKLASRLAALCDRALADAVRVSADGALKAEQRSHRAFVKTRGKWKELALDAAGFALLWVLLQREGEPVSREELGEALAAAAGREREPGTTSRRVAALKKALGPWKGDIASERGGFYRLISPA